MSLTLTFTSFGPAYAADAPRLNDAFLIIGQSNASGIIDKSFLGAANLYLTASYTGTQIIRQESTYIAMNQALSWSYYDGSTFTNIDVGAFTSSFGAVSPWAYNYFGTNATGSCGPDLTLSEVVNTPNNGAYLIVKMTVNSSPIEYWMPNATGTTPNLWTQLVSFITGSGVKVQGIYWHQGEANAISPTAFSNYAANLSSFVSSLRSQFGPVPLFIGMLSSGTNQSTCPQLYPARAVQQNQVNVTPYCTLINTDGLALSSADVVHLMPDSQATVGTNVANLFLTATNYPTTLSVSLADNVLGVISASNGPLCITGSVSNTGLNTAYNVRAWVTLPPGMNYVSTVGAGWTASASLANYPASTNVLVTFQTASVGAITPFALNCNAGWASGSMSASISVVANNAVNAATATDSLNLIGLGYTVDPIAGTPLPQNTAEWNTFITANSLGTWSPPNLLHTMQGSSTPLSPNIGAAQLGSVGSVTFQQPITGFFTKGVNIPPGANQYLSSSDSTLPDLSATSVLVLAFVDLQSTSLAASNFPPIIDMVSNAGLAAAWNSNTGDWFIKNGGNTAISTNVANGRGVVPIVLTHNVTNLSSWGISDKDKLVPTYAAMANTKYIGIGNDNTYNAGGQGVVYYAYWTGSHAEQTSGSIRSLLQAFNYSTLISDAVSPSPAVVYNI